VIRAAPPLALTMGEPAGVGPEITVHAWRNREALGLPPFFVIGDPRLFERAGAPVVKIAAPDEVSTARDALPILPEMLPVLPAPGTPSQDTAPATIRAIERAVALALEGAVAGIVTNPVAKATLYDAGFKHQGHTDFLGALTADAPHDGPRGPVMMLTAGDLRVALVSEHISLAAAPRALSIDRIRDVAAVTADALARDFGIGKPRLAVAALNPHAGEKGALGDEEIRIIAPAIAALQAAGIDAKGPFPADTLFHVEARARFDAVICMYHDQGLIPVEMLDFWGGVNVTLGLPIVRTSPDHGTGFEIAGKGMARADSLIAAIKLAAFIADRRAGR
jgi:4-hydroxythreonine-4-phosphate dehydrogenase